MQWSFAIATFAIYICIIKMLEIQNRLTTKQNLISEIEKLKSHSSTIIDSPVTDLEIQPQKAQFIETLTQALEKLSPFPRPLLYASNLLDGAWLLQYSTAREIRSLKRLPWGFLVGKIYQLSILVMLVLKTRHGCNIVRVYYQVT